MLKRTSPTPGLYIGLLTIRFSYVNASPVWWAIYSVLVCFLGTVASENRGADVTRRVGPHLVMLHGASVHPRAAAVVGRSSLKDGRLLVFQTTSYTRTLGSAERACVLHGGVSFTSRVPAYLKRIRHVKIQLPDPTLLPSGGESEGRHIHSMVICYRQNRWGGLGCHQCVWPALVLFTIALVFALHCP